MYCSCHKQTGGKNLKDDTKSFLVDGYDKKTRTIYEFQRCLNVLND